MPTATAAAVDREATAGAVDRELAGAIGGLHMTEVPTGDDGSDHGSCPPRRVAWGAEDEVVLLAEQDDTPSSDDTAAGVVQGDHGTAAAEVEAADATAGAVGEHRSARAAAEASDAAAGAAAQAASDATAAERGLPPGSSSVRPPPPGGVATGKWKGWYDDKRWHMVGGKEIYRSYGEGPHTGGSDCPQSQDPRRTDRNRRRKAKKERIRQEREADETKARNELWQRSYERQQAARSARSDGSEDSEED